MTTSTDAYRSVNLGTANPRLVIVRCLEAAVRYLEDGRELLARGESAEAPLSHARTIVRGLMDSLDFGAGDLARRLLDHYLFCLYRIQGSRAARQDQGLSHAADVLRTLKSAWEEMPAADARESLEAKRSSGVHLRG
jgi:flagellar protein FliS